MFWEIEIWKSKLAVQLITDSEIMMTSKGHVQPSTDTLTFHLALPHLNSVQYVNGFFQREDLPGKWGLKYDEYDG